MNQWHRAHIGYPTGTMNILLQIYLGTIVGLLLVAGLVHLIGMTTRRLGDVLCRAPMVDVVVFYFTALPWFPGAYYGGWAGLGVAVGGQITALWVWIIIHELTHPGARNGPRIYATLDGIVGRIRNHVAVWWTAWAVPLFWGIRLGEILVYPMLTWTVRLPKYRHRDWVNVSRQRFDGLVGYDLIWCLYCDWMTGVWSLGGEMLRNVESFWCPIRFYSAKKCENCVTDYPDIDGGWVDAGATMAEVTAVLEEKYTKDAPSSPWFGHPTRLTVEGEDVDGSK